jgi:DNA-directed RNA polymerase alpha subunit
MKFEWEELDESTWRAKVIGGWLIKARMFIEGERGVVMSESLTFIPDLHHKWNLDDDIDLLDSPIRDLNLYVRTMYCLHTEGIKTIGELIALSRHELLKTPNLGMKSLREIEEKLKVFNLSLKEV